VIHTDDPVLVRRERRAYSGRPGRHSHNKRRRASDHSTRSVLLRIVLAVLVGAGFCGIGYYGYTLGDQYVYQAYENWAFDQQIAGRTAVTFADYLRERTPLGFLAGKETAPAMPEVRTRTLPSLPSPAESSPPSSAPKLAEGSLLGRVEIARLNLSAIVREGVDNKTLSAAVGHVPSTSLPGQLGNFAIAAHRDTLFRALKDIRADDLVTFQSPAGTYMYQVVATKIVKPSDVSVLRSDGGGLVPGKLAEPGVGKLLTMITCYPFYYVGSAPKRFIVEARLVSDDIHATDLRSTVQVPLPASAPAPRPSASAHASSHSASSHAVKSVETGPQQFSAWPQSTARPPRKR
jgi:sortase A